MNARKLANIITALLEGEQGFVERIEDFVEGDSFKEVHVLMEGKWFSVYVREMDAEDPEME